MPPIQVRLLGTPEAFVGDEPAQIVPMSVQPLLAFLALRSNRASSRDELLDSLWPDVEPRKARHRLNTGAWRLRQLLRSPGGRNPIECDRSGHLRVSPDTVTFDIDHLLGLSERYPPTPGVAPNEAVHELSGVLASSDASTFMQGCYHDWVLAARERLIAAENRLIGSLVQARLEDNDAQAAIGWAELVVTRDPYREDMHRLLIDLYDTFGRPLDALRQFEECASILREHLGAEPLPETVMVAARVRERRRLTESSLPTEHYNADLVAALEAAMRTCRSTLDRLEAAAQILRRTRFD